MKKLPIILITALSSVLLLSACGKEEETPVTAEVPVAEQSIEDIAENTDGPEEPAEEIDEDPPPEEGMVRSRITNEWVTEEVNNARPLAIMTPNTKTAYHYGISNADVVYECNVEGSITRLMWIIQDWKKADKLGNVRSCRDYYVYWAFEWDALYVHFGGPFYIDEVISRTDDIDGKTSSNFFRDQSAKNSTDNAFIDAAGVMADVDKLGYALKLRDGYADEQHYRFAPAKAPNDLSQYSDAVQADKIDMSPAYPVTNCYFIYNSDTGLYERFQQLAGASDGPHVDLATGEQLAFKNVLVQNTYHEVRDDNGYLAFQCHDTTRDGWFFTNGKGIHVNWKKTSDYGATRYYDDAGNEIELNTGKTMVCIVEDGDSFLVDDRKIQ
ncbi:MAG: DUF3048 domain-containing protein [Bacteroidales bacterium]|nr:DUF3048 domain-containing protein [Bacteroidales bacterium]MCM1416195.1 DUF3048 domain-containing protein [bacterium]MCM1424641.1 DUF3048 domain-containing protein [bacterium]